jgi:hypothetical protein
MGFGSSALKRDYFVLRDVTSNSATTTEPEFSDTKGYLRTFNLVMCKWSGRNPVAVTTTVHF